jgi:hypothetical protein
MRAALAPLALALLLVWVIGIVLRFGATANWTLLGVAAALLAVRRLA